MPTSTRQPRNSDSEIRRILRDAWSLQERSAVVKTLTELATEKDGAENVRAAALLLAYAYGRPVMRPVRKRRTLGPEPAEERNLGLGTDNCSNERIEARIDKAEEAADRVSAPDLSESA